MSRFAADLDDRAGVHNIALTDTVTGAEARILPRHGAALWSLALAAVSDVHQPGTSEYTAANVTGDAEESTLQEHPEVAPVLESDTPDEVPVNPWFRGRILFPFNDRIPGGRYRFRGTTFQLQCNDPGGEDAIHGLVHNRSFDITYLTGTDGSAIATLERTLNGTESEGYPFRVRMTVTYELSSAGLGIGFHCQNCGDEPAPVAMGIHPYVRVEPSIAEAQLYCPAPATVEVDTRLLPTGRRPPTAGSALDFSYFRRLQGQELDVAFVRRDNSEKYTITELIRGSDIVTVWQSVPPFDYTQIFTAPDRRSIAVEPVTAATDSFNRPDLGLRVLSPGDSLTGHVMIARRTMIS